MTTVLGTCHHDCPDSCGWVVTVDGDRAVRLRGNAAHPYSRGELCPKVNRFLDRVYHPDRLTTPLIRTGAKGERAFRPATWDEALAFVAERVGAVVAEHGDEAVYQWNGAGTQGLIQMSCLDRRFFARLGATRQSGSLCGATAKTGLALTYGSGRGADPADVRHAELVLLWGNNTRLTNRHLWPFVEEARANGAQVVVIDPVRTITATEADWFLQPLPGTDVALMLGVIHVLIRDALVDREYVDRYTVGFDDLAGHVATWTPERAAKECGLEAVDVERLAALYGSTKKAFIRTLIGAEHYEHGAMFFRTLGVLPLLTGAWQERGGGLARSVGVWFEDQVADGQFDVDSPTRSLPVPQLGRHLTNPEIGVKALFVWCGNPLVSAPEASLIREGLAREDLFTVVSEHFLTDTAAYADVVFPATTQIEHLDVVPAWGHLYLGWNEPAIAPIGESVPNTELWRRLARAFGFDDPEFDQDDETLIRSALRDVDVDRLREDGFVRLDLPEDLRPYAQGGFATSDGRALIRNDGLTSIGLPVLPEYEVSLERARHRFSLMTPKTQTRFLNSSYSHVHGHLERAPVVEMTAEDLAALGIAEGERVRVSNERGALELTAAVSDRVRAGVVAIPWGWWGSDLNVNALTGADDVDAGGGVAFYDARVDVEVITVP